MGRQQGHVGSGQAGLVRTCGEEQRTLGRCDHNGAYTDRKVSLEWGCQLLETSRDSETHQVLSSPNGHSNQALLVHSLSPGQGESREVCEARVALQFLQARQPSWPPVLQAQQGLHPLAESQRAGPPCLDVTASSAWSAGSLSMTHYPPNPKIGIKLSIWL